MSCDAVMPCDTVMQCDAVMPCDAWSCHVTWSCGVTWRYRVMWPCRVTWTCDLTWSCHMTWPYRVPWPRRVTCSCRFTWSCRITPSRDVTWSRRHCTKTQSKYNWVDFMITYTWEVFDLVTFMSGVIFMQLYKSKQVLFIERWCRWLSFSHTASFWRILKNELKYCNNKHRYQIELNKPQSVSAGDWSINDVRTYPRNLFF